ncbi:MAG: TolC family protein [Ignavibacteriales bacterium]|nr:TolC family protein [Ignavibacteriales bacterium]
MRSLIGGLSIFLLFPPRMAICQPLTLDGAVEQALRKNERISQYEERVRQKEYLNMESWGNFLPSVNLAASYNHLNDPLEINLEPIRQAMIQLQSSNAVELKNLGTILAGGAPLTAAQRAAVAAGATAQLNTALPPFTETLKKQDYKVASLIGVQPLFLGGKLYAAKQYASSELASAEIELKKTKNEIIQETASQYFAVVLLQDVVRTRKDVLEGMERHRHDAQRLRAEGLIATHQVLRAEVAVAEAERNLFDDQNKLELALVALSTTLGLDDGSDLTVSDSLIFHPMREKLSVVAAQAAAGQPILLMIDQKKEAASMKFAAERAEFLPQIAAFGKYEMYPEYLSALEPRWVVGIQLNWSLFSGMKHYAKLEAAAHLEREVDFIRADAGKKVTLFVNKNYRDMENSANRYERLKANLALAEEDLKITNGRFQSGLATSLDVVDAELILEKNIIESRNSLFEYYKAMTDLFTASGSPEKVLSIWNMKEKTNDHQ